MIFTVVLLIVLAAAVAALLGQINTEARSSELSVNVTQGQLLAESALEAARADLDAGGTGMVGTVGWVDANGNGLADWDEVKDLAAGPVAFGDGFYWAHTAALADAQYGKITAYSRMGQGTASDFVTRLELVVYSKKPEVHPAFSGKYAIYAGNSGKIPNYTMTFAGSTWTTRDSRGRVTTTDKADHITGDIYSGGNLTGKDNSTETGKVEATGTVTGTMQQASGGFTQNAKAQVLPDFTAMDYRHTCDVDVGAAFTTAAATNKLYKRAKSSCASTENENIATGGVVTLPATNPGHIFAKESFTQAAYGPLANKTSATNYQLGDWVSSNTGETMKVSANGNHMSYYVPGNLWIDGQGISATFGLGTPSTTDGAQITIVVEGNIYVGDDVFYNNKTFDALGLIAIAQRYPDTDVRKGQIIPPGDPLYRKEGSGNIYFGDLNASTTACTDNLIMFAEGNFADIVKSSSGTPLEFTINGLMAANNQVILLDRGTGQSHSPFRVTQDARLLKPVVDGGISLPHLPWGNPTNPDKPPQPPWVPIVLWQGR